MDWKKAEILNDDLVKIPERWLHLYYYEAFNILFRFENSLRIFVYVILKKNLLDKWDEAAITENTTIRTETKKRISQAREHGYLGYEVTSPMLYLNSGELMQIITHSSYWKYFAPYFKASKSIVTTKLQEIGTVRNSFAHFRPLKNDDIDLIKQNSKHVLLEIENCLVQLVSITNVVPTNSHEDWYKEIKSIGNEHFSTSLFLSKDQDWIRVEISYNIPTLQKSSFGGQYWTYSVGSIRTDQIIKKSNAIRDNCIYMSEQKGHASLDSNFDIVASKKISIVFSKESLEKNYAAIADELREIAINAESETALVLNDHLARGNFVEVKSATAAVKELNGHKYWQVDIESLQTSLTEVEEIEFWGQRFHFAEDFISATSHYPWMPSSVSKVSWAL